MKFEFTLTGLTPLLMHADDVMLSDAVKAWQKDSKNKDMSVAGDDRSPPWVWQTYCYTDGKTLCVPTDNIAAAMLQAGAQMTLKKSKTFKEVSQSGLFYEEDFLPLLVDGKPVESKAIDKLKELDFAKQAEAVLPLGFSLFVKRANVNGKKHVRVRPKFNAWSLKGTVEIIAPEITEERLNEMFGIAGAYKGLCDWRPGSPKRPGRFGKFKHELKRID